MRRTAALLTILALLCDVAQASAAVGAQAVDMAHVEAAIRARFTERYPEVAIRSVAATPWPGVFEVVAADGIIYTDATADHAMSGSIIETRTQRNLTESRWTQANRIDFKSLPFDHAIKVVQGDGSRVLAVFADPDCPYCRKLEAAMKDMPNLTVYTFLYPITELHPDAKRHAQQIWCSDDAPASWAAWMQQRTPPKGESCATEPTAELAALGRRLNIIGTPTMFLADGTRLRGAMERDELEQHLASVAH